MKRLIFLFALLISTLGCTKEDDSLAVVEISTGESSNITTNSATVSLTCNNATGLAYVGVMCSKETTFEDASTVDLNTKTSVGGTFDFSLTGLVPGITYYYKGYAMDGRSNRVYGTVKTFITESPSLSLSESMISVIGGGETKQIQVISNSAWTAVSNQDWCKVLTASGSDNGSMSFIVSKNDGTAERSAVITVTSGALSQTLTVVQQASSISLAVSTDSFSPASGSGTYKFTVTSNTAWTATSNQSWCVVTPALGTGNAEISFSVQSNVSLSPRTATITILAGSAKQTVTVMQDGASANLAVSSNNFSMTAAADSKSFTITSNTSWTVSSNQTWCTVSTTTGSGNGTVTFGVSANANTTSRTATITVSSSSTTQQITITQQAGEEAATLTVSSGSFAMTAESGSNTFTITSNRNWTVSSNHTWCTISPASGTNNGTVTFYVTANTATTQRTAIITVTAGSQTQTVSIVQAGQTASSDNIVFADATFKSYCVSNFDTNHDGEISKAEAMTVTEIGISPSNIMSLQGIEFFTALTQLYCDDNQLTQLDVSKNTALKGLYCDKNKLTQLDVSKNPELEKLYCGWNQLTQLDVSNNTALTYLLCNKNQLTQLDVSNNTMLKMLSCPFNQLANLYMGNNSALTYLYCENNKLTQFDVSKNTALDTLYCSNNQLTQLDVSKNTALTTLCCENNQLTQLNVSNNTMLTWLYCYNNQLTQLDVSNNTVLTTLWCLYNSNLTKLYLKAGQTISFLLKDDQTEIIYK